MEILRGHGNGLHRHERVLESAPTCLLVLHPTCLKSARLADYSPIPIIIYDHSRCCGVLRVTARPEGYSPAGR